MPSPHLLLCGLVVLFLIPFLPGGQVTFSLERPDTVTTTLGTIRGHPVHADDLLVVWEFLGVPYARPPVGNLRFRPPVPAGGWSGIYHAKSNMPGCMQYTGHIVGGNASFLSTVEPSEDCLYMNVWVPRQTRKGNATRIPIVVFVHGGGFLLGSISGKFNTGWGLAAYGRVIVFSMNYRLGVFGFLDAGLSDAPGNVGLMDQRLALLWIRDNAAAFGGNPQNITLMGTSSGAIAVSLHLHSSMSQGYFSRAVLLGGSAVKPIAPQSRERSTELANELVQLLPCPELNAEKDSIADTVQCLVRADAFALAFAQAKLSTSWANTFKPTYGNVFLPEFPAPSGVHQDHMAIMIGTSQNEGSLLLRPEPDAAKLKPPDVRSVDQAMAYMVKRLDDFGLRVSEGDLRIYFAGGAKTEAYLVQIMSDILTDAVFACPVMLFGENAAYHGDLVLMYVFGHSRRSRDLGDWVGVPHGSDFAYAFGLPFTVRDIGFDAEDYPYSEEVMTLIGTFARNGDIPGSDTRPPWRPFTALHKAAMILRRTDATLGAHPRAVMCDFWEKIYRTSST